MGRAGRAFLARRQGVRDGQALPRWHVGLDLQARAGDPVVACEAGRIVDFALFYRARSGQRTYRLLVAHPEVVVNYGEVTADSLTRHGLAVGDSVRAGQPIGVVSDTNMLHFETYTQGTVRSFQWRQGDPRIGALLNPTCYLLALQARGKATRRSPPGTRNSSWEERSKRPRAARPP